MQFTSVNNTPPDPETDNSSMQHFNPRLMLILLSINNNCPTCFHVRQSRQKLKIKSNLQRIQLQSISSFTSLLVPFIHKIHLRLMLVSEIDSQWLSTLFPRHARFPLMTGWWIDEKPKCKFVEFVTGPPLYVL